MTTAASAAKIAKVMSMARKNGVHFGIAGKALEIPDQVAMQS